MTATLTFDIHDLDDELAHFQCIKAKEMALCLWYFRESLSKLADTCEDGKHIDYELVHIAFNEALEEYDINLDKLIV